MPTRGQLLDVITAALADHDMQAVAAALRVLAVVSPDDAALILATVKAASR